MRNDVEIRPRPPRKRRQLEQALDVELATWLALDDLTPSERKKVQTEKERRKRDVPPVVGLVWAKEGRTPAQFAEVQGMEFSEAMAGKSDFHAFIKGLDHLVALPKEMSKLDDPPDDSVWAYVRYARHRGVPVKVIRPDGSEYKEDNG